MSSFAFRCRYRQRGSASQHNLNRFISMEHHTVCKNHGLLLIIQMVSVYLFKCIRFQPHLQTYTKTYTTHPPLDKSDSVAVGQKANQLLITVTHTHAHTDNGLRTVRWREMVG